jgi:uncharacterized protein YabN with tetrapyrrole methylase and pyrophosphatase domain
LQVVFHCQLAGERGAFDFQQVAQRITDKLVRRHPHVFGSVKVKNVDEVWANWEKIKTAEKHGTRHARPSALDGIPKHLPALLKAEKLLKKARKAKLPFPDAPRHKQRTKTALAGELFELVRAAQSKGWSAEELLRAEIKKQERALRRLEKSESKKLAAVPPRGATLRRALTASDTPDSTAKSRLDRVSPPGKAMIK